MQVSKGREPRVVGIVTGFASLTLYFRFVAKNRLRGFKYATSSIGGRCWNVVIGGLSRAFYELATGLLPFWQDPLIFFTLGLYFLLILDVISMKRWLARPPPSLA